MIIVEKAVFLEHISYRKKLNRAKLKDLDLRDFGLNPTTKELDDWRFTGLTNIDFIKAHIGEGGQHSVIIKDEKGVSVRPLVPLKEKKNE